jgi:hypothetical protein
MTREDVRNQIKAYEEKIVKLEKEFSKEVISTKEEINAKFNSQFEDALTNFRIKMKKGEEINNNSQKFLTKRKEEKNALKILKKEISTLTKRKINEIKGKLKSINRQKRDRIDKYSKEIKNLKKKIKELKAKNFAERWKKWRHL